MMTIVLYAVAVVVVLIAAGIGAAWWYIAHF